MSGELDAGDKVVKISSECLESDACQHSVTVLTADNRIREFLQYGHKIWKWIKDGRCVNVKPSVQSHLRDNNKM